MKKISIVLSIAIFFAMITLSQLQTPTAASSISFDNGIIIQTRNLGIVNTVLPSLQPLPTINLDQFFHRSSNPSATPAPTTTTKPTTTAATSPTATTTTKPTQTPTSTTNTSYTDQVIQLVNNERSKVGLPALTRNDNLTDAAQKYAQYMASANFFSHTGRDGSTFTSRIKASGYASYRWAGENIAAGQTSPQEVMTGWMNSSGHKANILNSNAKEIGVGYAVNKNSQYGTYWVQEFGAR